MTEMVHRQRRIFISHRGESVPITDFIGSDGEECEPEEAVVAVAGPTIGGFWVTLDLSEFSRETIH